MGQRYGCLPSQILTNGNTFDLEVLDIALSYEKFSHNKREGVLPDIPTEDLQAVMNKVKGHGT